MPTERLAELLRNLETGEYTLVYQGENTLDILVGILERRRNCKFVRVSK